MPTSSRTDERSPRSVARYFGGGVSAVAIDSNNESAHDAKRNGSTVTTPAANGTTRVPELQSPWPHHLTPSIDTEIEVAPTNATHA